MTLFAVLSRVAASGIRASVTARSPLRSILPACLPSSATSRFYAASINLPADIDYEELQDAIKTKKLRLFDVRSPKELKELGWVAESSNMELRKIGHLALMDEGDFEEELGYKKPEVNEALAVMCMAGVRARTAQLALIGAGYTNVRVYPGSFEDWVEQGGPLEYAPPEEEES